MRDACPIETSDPVKAMRILRGAVIAEVEATTDRLQYLKKQLQAIDHVVELINTPEPPADPTPDLHPDSPKKPMISRAQARADARAIREREVAEAVKRFAHVKSGARLMAEHLNAKGIKTSHRREWSARATYQKLNYYRKHGKL